MRGRDAERAPLEQTLEDGLSQRRPFRGIGPGAQLVQEHERIRSRHRDRLRDPAQVREERAHVLHEGLLVADVADH